MNEELIRQFLLSCHEARRVCELLPDLPPRIKPRHIRIIDCIHRLHQEGETVRVSDVAEAMDSTMPSITKLVNELCDMEIVKKRQGRSDRRVFTLTLTDLGNHYYDMYVTRFHGWLCQEMQDIPEDDVRAMITVVRRMKDILQKGREKYGPLK
ncbi:MarR family winged helix-turn-helix transcriptional regulator [uncultured Dialister sp.]|uniref:MarR family winged helix-turn-helix transcriptional regulator n=1 Tax=uncultured Dialister sp. TaxID=278064 RepID=UPI00262749B0|nr:MarR family transcriptional regulator [uncultured Dialister sp.]